MRCVGREVGGIGGWGGVGWALRPENFCLTLWEFLVPTMSLSEPSHNAEGAVETVPAEPSLESPQPRHQICEEQSLQIFVPTVPLTPSNVKLVIS